jgi:phosphoglycerol transferase MdoB-like AlkP superfamily enzyme
MILIGTLKKSNIYLVLLYRIFLAMFLFSLSRIGFFLFNHKMFPGMDVAQFFYILRGGLVFDLSAIVYINIFFILLCILPFDFRYSDLYQKILKYLFLIANGVAICMNGMDFVYYKFIGKRATSDVFGTFSNESHIFKMFFRFLIDYWQATIFTLFLLAVMIYLYNVITTAKPEKDGKLRRFIISFVMMPLIAALTVGAARGGYRHSTRPITISNAAKYVQNPEDVAIVLNTPFSILRTYGKKALTDYNFFKPDRLNTIYNTHYIPSGINQFRSENVVIIILESFAREYIGAYNHGLENGQYTGYTPFMDSLISESLTFDVSVSNGRKSIDAMPSILASIPSLETPYIISHYANNQINALPSLLKRKGYYTAFFHGAPNGSMGFDSFAKLAGFDDYFGLDQYPDKNDFDGMWGVWDEPFLKFFASKLDTFREPFMASVFTISSHHPFEVPTKYKGRFKKGPAPIVEVVGYTDYALRQFFKQISGSKWFNNTLFVLTADHTNESVHKEYQNDYGVYSIPVIFYKPGSDLKGVKNRIAQQIDIMPTILNYLNYDEEYIAFGNDLLNDSIESFAYNTNGSTYHIYMRDHLLEMADNKILGLFNFKTDTYLQNNLMEKDPVLQQVMEDKLRAIMQTYNSRLIHNDMVVRNDVGVTSR